VITVLLILWVVCVFVCHVGVLWLNPKWLELTFDVRDYHREQLLCVRS